jgi:hypothetical protein
MIRFTLAIFLLIFAANLKAQADTLPYRLLQKGQHLLSFGAGAALWNLEPLSQLIYQNKQTLTRSLAISVGSMYAFNLSEHSRLSINFNRIIAYNRAPAPDYLELDAFLFTAGYGYLINPEKKWSFLPQVGLGLASHNLFWERGPGLNANAASQFASVGTTTRLSQENYIAEVKLSFLHTTQSTVNTLFGVTHFGFHLAFSQRLGATRWFKRYDQSLAGPSLFSQIFSAQLSYVWKL